MAKGFLEYLDEIQAGGDPASDPGAAETVKAYYDIKDTEEQARQLKESISQQIEAGSAPQYILMPAIAAIGILTKDTEWGNRMISSLEGIYPNITQESLFIDQAAANAGRLENRREEYLRKLEKRVYKEMLELERMRIDFRNLHNEIKESLGELVE